MRKEPSTIEENFTNFVKEIKSKILSSQYEALKTVNKELINLYWEIGKNIVEKQEQYGWGKSVVQNLSHELQKEFVRMKGFSVQNLWNMRQFYLEYYQNEKLQTLSREIGWSHNVAVFQKCKDSFEREFYIKMVIKFGWTYRVLDNHIDNKSYEKFLLNQTNFDFLELDEEHSEYQVEIGLINKIREFLAQMGTDFAFVGKFKPEYAGKMNFYLSVLNDTVKLPEENPSIGIIICKEKKRTTVEYALKDSNQPIGVATYKLTESLPVEFQDLLPTPSEISQRLENLLESEKAND